MSFYSDPKLPGMHRPRSEGCKSRERSYEVFPLDCGLRRNDECILIGNDLSRTVLGISRNDVAAPEYRYNYF